MLWLRNESRVRGIFAVWSTVEWTEERQPREREGVSVAKAEGWSVGRVRR